MIIGGVIQASTFGAGQLIAGRIISGIGNGTNDPEIACTPGSMLTTFGRAKYVDRASVCFRDFEKHSARKVPRHSDVYCYCMNNSAFGAS